MTDTDGSSVSLSTRQVGWTRLFAIVMTTALAVAFIWRLFTPTDFMEKASVDMKRGDRRAASVALRSHLAQHPEAAVARLKLAKLIHDQAPDEALQLLKEIPKTALERPAAMSQMAAIYLLDGRTQEAETALLELVKTAPQQLGPRLSLAELYFQHKNTKQALGHAQKAAELEPNRAQTWLLLAEIRDDLRQHAQMIPPLETAIQLQPNLYAAHVNLAYAAYKIGRLPEAAEQAHWCLDRNPKDVFAIRTLASVARDEGRMNDAEKQVQAALDVSPNDVDCKILEADLLLYNRNPLEAYKRLRTIFDEQKSTFRYLGTLARAAAALGNRNEAKKLHEMMADLRR